MTPNRRQRLVEPTVNLERRGDSNQPCDLGDGECVLEPKTQDQSVGDVELSERGVERRPLLAALELHVGHTVGVAFAQLHPELTADEVRELAPCCSLGLGLGAVTLGTT